MSETEALLGDLRAEGDELDGLVAGLGGAEWRTATPAPGWSIAHQIAHLAWTDERAVQAAEDPQGFADEVRRAWTAPEAFVDEGAERGAAEPPEALLELWRAGRDRLLRTLAAQPPRARLPWYGPPMSVMSMATARLMETWAHGQDVADALGVRRAPTARLRHVARIGVRARGYAYAARGLEPSAEEFRVELTGPDGELWTYGPKDAAQRVTGPALDFCLLVIQRAHRDDLAVRAEGADADRWLDIAQAFAGPPGKGRAPGQGAGDTARGSVVGGGAAGSDAAGDGAVGSGTAASGTTGSGTAASGTTGSGATASDAAGNPAGGAP
ncbi:TIGR03084 family metal-binding protein [Streptomyces sp. 11-1-2]|uniref:TIGR03084 family metal-binding protein n=1 Tax=Streptomyces sp. 11-1-2 TaxID=1851167 RepID=UPI000B8DA345|nr:TIGR03084 family metal-binding protein [Streptomyces sp. 11-1-2]ASQ95332.1 TIGR03084 family protein [Streptomyces sp. 11-1-2]